jgi:parvulin-like peptidyl-prolyl isomerase
MNLEPEQVKRTRGNIDDLVKSHIPPQRRGGLQIKNKKDFLRASMSQRLYSTYCVSIKIAGEKKMKSLVRSCCIMVLVFSVLLIVSGCAKHTVSDEPIVPLTGPALLEAKRTVVARVNGADITRYSLITMMNRIQAGNRETSKSESRAEIRKKALDRLVLQELVFQEAVRQGLHIEQPNIDRGIDNLRLKLGGEAQLQDYMAKETLTMEELRSQVERLLLMDRILSREVRDKASVSENDIKNEYEKQKGLYIAPEKITVVDVVFFLKQDDEASTRKANEVLAKINADPDKNPMNLDLDKTFFAQELDLDKEREPALYSAARKLREGELSGVIKGKDSIHIIKLTKNSPERQMSYDEVKGTVEGKLKAARLKERRQVWERELKKRAKIEQVDAPEQQKQKKP